MKNRLTEKYGLITAISMVIGIVIGSGIFFKAEKVLETVNGNILYAAAAWLLGGAIMLACAQSFGIMAEKYGKINGIVDYAEAAVGKKYAYYTGWFMATIYYPTLCSVLSWLSARYTLIIFGNSESDSGLCMTLASLYLITAFVINTISPSAAGKIQVTATVIKLIPLLLMAIFGTIYGLREKNGVFLSQAETAFNFSNNSGSVFTALVSTAFAYEGWIIATSINAELKNAKKNLPIALTGGAAAVIIIYVLYQIGLAGAEDTEILTAEGAAGIQSAFSKIFGSFLGNSLMAFIAVSCLGTLNGVMLGCVRGMYSLAARNEGPAPDIFSQLDSKTNMPVNSSVFGLLTCILWLFYYYGSNISEPLFGPFRFDSSELPIITLYAIYIPIYICFIFKEKTLGIIKRAVIPSFGIAASLTMIGAAWFAHKESVLYYLIIFAAIMLCGIPFSNQKKSENEISDA